MKSYIVSFYGEITVEANNETEAEIKTSSELYIDVDLLNIISVERAEEEIKSKIVKEKEYEKEGCYKI